MRADLRYGGLTTSQGSSDQTDADGIFTIAREAFIDSARKLDSFRIAPKIDYTSNIVPVMFSAQVPLPDDLDTLTTVPIEAHSLKFRFVPHRDIYNGKTLHMNIQKVNERGSTESVGTIGMNMPYQEEITLPAVQPGTYEILITDLPRAAIHRMRLEPHPQAELHEIKLPPGATLKWKFVKPADWNDDWGSLNASLTKDGKPFEFGIHLRIQNYSTSEKVLYNIPAGNYVLHIKPEKRARTQAVKPTTNYEPLEIPFAIDENSPAEIDLGELRLKQIP